MAYNRKNEQADLIYNIILKLINIWMMGRQGQCSNLSQPTKIFLHFFSEKPKKLFTTSVFYIIIVLTNRKRNYNEIHSNNDMKLFGVKTLRSQKINQLRLVSIGILTLLKVHFVLLV